MFTPFYVDISDDYEARCKVQQITGMNDMKVHERVLSIASIIYGGKTSYELPLMC